MGGAVSLGAAKAEPAQSSAAGSVRSVEVFTRCRMMRLQTLRPCRGCVRSFFRAAVPIRRAAVVKPVKINSTTPAIIKMKSIHLLSLTTALALAAAASAQVGELQTKGAKADIREVVQEKDGPEVPPELRTPRIDARMEKMRLLIVQGIKAGQLTAGEASSLEHELSRIEREEEIYKRSSRKVGPRERKDLNRDINQLHERIWAKTHNGAKPSEPLAK